MVKNPNDSRSNSEWLKTSLLVVASNIIGVIVGAAAVGYWMGGKFNDPLTGSFIGAFIGLLYGFYQIWRLVKKK